MGKELSTEQTYKQLLATIKQQVKSAQAKVALAVNSSLIQLYVSALIQQLVGLNKNESKKISVQQLVAPTTLSVPQPVRPSILKTN